MSACHSRIRFGDLLPCFEVRHQLAVVNVQHVGRHTELGMACLDLRLAPLRQRTAGLREVADVAIGQCDQLDLMSLRGEERRRPREFQFGIVGVRAECNDAQLPGARFPCAAVWGGRPTSPERDTPSRPQRRTRIESNACSTSFGAYPIPSPRWRSRNHRAWVALGRNALTLSRAPLRRRGLRSRWGSTRAAPPGRSVARHRLPVVSSVA